MGDFAKFNSRQVAAAATRPGLGGLQGSAMAARPGLGERRARRRLRAPRLRAPGSPPAAARPA
jgi:hypothetical protein